MADANSDIRDLLLKHQHVLRRVENGALQDMIVPFNLTKSELTAKLSNLQATYLLNPTLSNQRKIEILQNSISEVDAVLTSAALESSDNLEQVLYDIANIENEFTFGILSSAFETIGISLNAIPFNQVDYIATHPLLGETVGDKMLWNNRNVVNGIRSELEQTIIQGEDIGRATRRLIGRGRTLGGSVGATLKDRAEKIARSEILFVSNQVNRAIFAENKDVISGVVFTATLDGRTCIICGSLDGKVYPFLSEDQDHGGPVLPLHVNCRCVYSPVTKSWEELGVDPNNLTGKNYFTGEEPDILTYEEWLTNLNKKNPSEVKGILGPARYKLWNSGDISFTSMATDRKILSLKDLKSRL